MGSFERVLLGLATVFAIALAPPVFERAFSMGDLLARERPALWLLAATLPIAALACRGHRSRRVPWGLLLFSVLVVLAAELGTRAVVKAFLPDREAGIAAIGNATYDDLRAYRGHPFLHFTGRPGAAVSGNDALGDMATFNDIGFPGRDTTIDKPAGTVRVATLGGSTTASGYPEVLEEILLADPSASDDRFEVLNFGLGFYTTAHSLVNYALNVTDYDVDFVVIHHAWNDEKARRTVAGFRGDYAHALKAFETQRYIPDRYLLRSSVLYRLLLRSPPEWAYVEAAAVVRREKTERYADPRQLRPYRRNLETIVDLALARGTTPVLTTMPRSTDRAKPYFSAASHIDECNAIVRAIAARSPEDVVLVDLDAAMTGAMEASFRDLGHVDAVGRRFKAQLIAEALLAHRRGATSAARRGRE